MSNIFANSLKEAIQHHSVYFNNKEGLTNLAKDSNLSITAIRNYLSGSKPYPREYAIKNLEYALNTTLPRPKKPKSYGKHNKKDEEALADQRREKLLLAAYHACNTEQRREIFRVVMDYAGEI